MEKRTTIYDIAKALNITVSTVSRALNNISSISEETRNAVWEMAKKLNYRPNKIATSLSSGKTNIIGIIIPSAKIQFFSSVIHSLEQALKKAGYSILLYQTNESIESEKNGIQTLLEAQVDGIIISLSLETDNIDHIRKVESEGKPLIIFDRVHSELNVPSVAINDIQAGYIATKHLIDSGYKKIAYVSTRHKIKIFDDRFKGYINALQEANMPINENFVILDELSIQGGIKATEKLLKLKEKPDAIIGGDDFTALGIIKGLSIKGIVPPKIGVIGFANQTFSEYITPSLSTIDQQAVKMGQECASLFLRLISKKTSVNSPEKIILDPILIARDSTR
ncbi:LacI family DNA-binding transcriptional regulator [Sphingobacterium pedocola]|uniref:LacI family transcriptional regulator n=1 Tax=Sphingobacterium pedocola TaxID=2082722 RepID=A0ABR9T531_9SPHI|nr:LacI family DNA-binding transcriptional regulator [Sphingobacterium pedocola]MBE8720446.1 LacI family transcriptional regulator [Sphingobacterium pedocola]